MTDKEFRRLSKADLIDIIFELQKNEKILFEKIEAIKAQLDSKSIKISSAGSIAEAAISINGVFEAAQAAADQYIEQVKANADSEAMKIIEEAKQRAAKIVSNESIEYKDSVNCAKDDNAQ